MKEGIIVCIYWLIAYLYNNNDEFKKLQVHTLYMEI